MAGRWRMQECEGALAGAQQVEDLLDLPLLQRLAQQRAQEIRILEADDTFEFIQVLLHANSPPGVGYACLIIRSLWPWASQIAGDGNTAETACKACIQWHRL